MRSGLYGSVIALALIGCKTENNLIEDNSADLAGSDEPCIIVTPDKIQFGEISAVDGEPVTQAVTIENRCADDPGDASLTGTLTLGGVTIEDTTAPFTLTQVGTVLLPGLSSTEFAVTFAPNTAATWRTKVFIDSNDPDEPRKEVKLIGTGLAPVIEVTPAEHDFGTQYIGCPYQQPMKLSNVGNDDLVFDRFNFATGSAVDFKFDHALTLPATVLPGESVEVYVNYTAYDTFDDESWLTVFSNDPFHPEVLTHQTAGGKKYGDHNDVFEQPLRSSSDILWVIDTSGSMGEEQTYLSDNFEVFVETLEDADADYQLAVITTDTPTFRGDIITPDMSDPVGEFQTQALAGTMGSGDEQGSEMAYQAVDSGDAAPGSDFLRDRSVFSIVVLSDEPDSSRARSTEDYVDFFIAAKGGDADLFRYHAIAGDYPTPACGTAAAGNGYYQASVLTGGTFVSICAADWSTGLTSLALGSVSINDSFELTQEPVPRTIKVKVDGASTTVGWEYDPLTQQLEFDKDYIPPAGSTIEISYELLPSCEG